MEICRHIWCALCFFVRGMLRGQYAPLQSFICTSPCRDILLTAFHRRNLFITLENLSKYSIFAFRNGLPLEVSLNNPAINYQASVVRLKLPEENTSNESSDFYSCGSVSFSWLWVSVLKLFISDSHFTFHSLGWIGINNSIIIGQTLILKLAPCINTTFWSVNIPCLPLKYIACTVHVYSASLITCMHAVWFVNEY